MESTINEMLRHAIDVIDGNDKIKIEHNSRIKIKGIYESYIAQFGALENQLLMPSTFAVYCNKKANVGEGDRSQIIQMIFKVINLYHTNYFGVGIEYDAWIKKIMKNQDHFADEHEQIILDASVALKRAIRTFELLDK